MFYEPTPIHRIQDREPTSTKSGMQDFSIGNMPSISSLAFGEDETRAGEIDHNNGNGQDISEIIQRYKAFIDEVKQRQLRETI